MIDLLGITHGIGALIKNMPKLIKAAADHANTIAKKVDDFLRGSGKFTDFVSKFGSKTKASWNKLNGDLQEQFFKEYGNNTSADFLQLLKNGDAVGAWDAVFSSPAFRKNVDNFTTVDDYFKANPGKFDEFKGQFDDIPSSNGKRAFLDDHAEYNRASKLNSQERVNELAYDPKNNSTDLYEGEIGQLVESNYGYFKRDPSGAGDFISLTGTQRGKVIDVFGIPQSAIQHHGDDLANFLPSVDQHFYKVQSGGVDVLELDIRAMNSAQVQTLQNYINNNWSNLSSQLNYIQ